MCFLWRSSGARPGMDTAILGRRSGWASEECARVAPLGCWEVVPRSSGLVKAELEDTGCILLALSPRNGGNRGGQIFERDLSRIPGPGRLAT